MVRVRSIWHEPWPSMPDSSQTSLQMLGNKDRPAPTAVESPPDAKAVITRFYEAYNRGDLDTVASLMAEEVEYHDMIYEEPFRGKAQVMAFMAKVRRTVPSDLQFVVEDITQGDPRRVGLTWHVEIGEGTVFPFSRGCSFYTLDDSGRILKVAIKGALASRRPGGTGQGTAGGQARDLVAGAFKPGAGALLALAASGPPDQAAGPQGRPPQPDPPALGCSRYLGLLR
ncbi:hypothetical protein QJQ45_029640, partial [Haematococcus lacustris]